MRAPSRGPSGSPPWLRPVTDRLSPTITTLVVVSVLTWAFYALVKPARPLFESHLALRPSVLIVPEPWQVLSSLFVHLDPLSLFFNMLGIWFVGATIERELGRKRFLILFFVPALLGNLLIAVGMLFSLPGSMIHAGSGLSVLALFVVFAKLYGRTQVRVFGSMVLEARTLVLILVGFSLVANLANYDLVGFVADLVAIGVAFGLTGRGGSGFDDLFRGLPGGKPRRRFEVVEGGQKPGPKSKEGRRAGYLN